MHTFSPTSMIRNEISLFGLVTLSGVEVRPTISWNLRLLSHIRVDGPCTALSQLISWLPGRFSAFDIRLAQTSSSSVYLRNPEFSWKNLRLALEFTLTFGPLGYRAASFGMPLPELNSILSSDYLLTTIEPDLSGAVQQLQQSQESLMRTVSSVNSTLSQRITDMDNLIHELSEQLAQARSGANRLNTTIGILSGELESLNTTIGLLSGELKSWGYLSLMQTGIVVSIIVAVVIKKTWETKKLETNLFCRVNRHWKWP